MEQLSTFEMIMLGAVALGVLFWVGPGIKGMLEQSRKAENKAGRAFYGPLHWSSCSCSF